MGWICSKDGKTNSDDTDVCPVCGATRPSRVALVGPCGKLDVRIKTVVGASLLARVVGEDSKFCSNPQYRLECDDDNFWRVMPMDEAAANITVVNGAFVPPEGVSVKAGDVIAVASRKDASKAAAAVTIEQSFI